MWRLNSMLLKYQWVSDEIKEIRKCFETSNIDKTTSRNLWDIEKAILREKYTGLQEETIKISNKQPKLGPKESEKEQSLR